MKQFSSFQLHLYYLIVTRIVFYFPCVENILKMMLRDAYSLDLSINSMHHLNTYLFIHEYRYTKVLLSGSDHPRRSATYVACIRHHREGSEGPMRAIMRCAPPHASQEPWFVVMRCIIEYDTWKNAVTHTPRASCVFLYDGYSTCWLYVETGKCFPPFVVARVLTKVFPANI